MRNSILAFAACLMVVGCGSNPTKLDGGGGDGGGMDMTGGGGGDMAKPVAAACGAIYSCVGGGKTIQQCTAKSSQGSKDKFAAFLGCLQQTCGVMGTDAGANAPCMQPGDAGDANCNQCFDNVIGGAGTFFVDANQMPLACKDDGSGVVNGAGGDCGKCLMTAEACIFECINDADCAGLTHNDGSPATCDTTTAQCV